MAASTAASVVWLTPGAIMTLTSLASLLAASLAAQSLWLPVWLPLALQREPLWEQFWHWNFSPPLPLQLSLATLPPLLPLLLLCRWALQQLLSLGPIVLQIPKGSIYLPAWWPA